MKKLFAIILFASVALFANQTHAQMDDPVPNNGGGSTTATKCPDDLMFFYSGNYFYQLKNCSTNLLTNEIEIFSNEIQTGCQNETTCNCSGATSTLSKYADPNARLFVPLGEGVSTHQSTEAMETVKAGGKVFRTISIRLKGKKTTGADNQLECIALFGLELDPETETSKSGTLSGNKLTYDGREFKVLTKGPAANSTPN